MDKYVVAQLLCRVYLANGCQLNCTIPPQAVVSVIKSLVTQRTKTPHALVSASHLGRAAPPLKGNRTPILLRIWNFLEAMTHKDAFTKPCHCWFIG